MLSQKPGPKCEETGAEFADGTAAAVSGLVGLFVAIASLECLDGQGCSDDEAPQLYASSVGLIAATAIFSVSARHGARMDEACRRARGWPEP